MGKIPCRRKWQPIPVFLSGKPHERRSLAGDSPWGREELDTTERLHFPFLSTAVQRILESQHTRCLSDNALELAPQASFLLLGGTGPALTAV